MNTILNQTGKVARFGGFGTGLAIIVKAAEATPVDWPKIAAGAVVCVACFIWSLAHDRKISE